MPIISNKSDVSLSLSANQALDYITANYMVILAFAGQEDFDNAWKHVSKKCSLMRIKVVRVEPTEEHALDLQINRYPTYVLYRSGNESWMVLGNTAFTDKIEDMRP